MLKGKDGVVKIGNPRVALGEVQSFNVDESADRVSGWGMGDSYENSFTTVKRWEGSVEVYLDHTDESALVKVGDELDVDFYFGGETAGYGYFTGNVAVTGLNRSTTKDGIPALNINFAGNGALTEGTAP